LVDERPDTIPKYITWLAKEHDVHVSARTKNHYESAVARMLSEVESSSFWMQLSTDLRNYHERYLLDTGYDLLLQATPVKLELLTKPYESLLLKSFRRNILDNALWPGEPKDGWVLPSNWFSQVGDLVRARLVVKYLDGITFVIDRVKEVADKTGCPCDVALEAREEGYYAAHLGIGQKVEIPKVNWDTETITTSFEIQLTTQLQDVIGRLLHKYYEERRSRSPAAPQASKWQWDYQSEEFVANYLGHILHYVEGMIMDVRSRQAASASGLLTPKRTERRL